MKRITYISRFADGLTPQQIRALGEDAARRNRELGITGVLLCSDGLFFQIIEGDDETVDALFGKLRHDGRHRDIMCLEHKTQLTERSYADWSMEVIDLTQSTDLLMRPIRGLANSLARTHGILEHYAQPAVRRLIESGLDPLTVPAERRERVVFFADVVSFSAISAVLDACDTMAFASTFAEACTGAVADSGGEVLKLLGDGVMAHFDPDDADAAVRAAVDSLHRLAAIRRAAGPTQPQRALYCGIGIDCGEVVEGNIGSVIKMDYTLIGDTVNNAAHLQSLTRRLPRRLALSALVADGIGPSWRLENMGRHALKVRGRRVDVFSVADPATLKRGSDHDRQAIQRFVVRARQAPRRARTRACDP